VTLAHLERLADRGELSPDLLWRALAPLLVDSAGNAHRAELNIEKLWNPFMTAHGTRHGKMGLVELRAVRMPERPEMLGALAALVRAIIARLVVSDYREPLVDWHDELHDRYALPSALSRDLRLVLGDLDDHGLGLPAQLRHELDAWRSPGIACRLGDATLVLVALEFWPLIGDVASQERAGARIVDASTQRLEISLEGGPDRVAINGRWAVARTLGDTLSSVGVRRRVYVPSLGLHPDLPPLDPLVIEWAHAGRAQRIELWAWKPDGGPYPGLPTDADDALARRSDRIRVTNIAAVTATGHWPETRPFIDLRLGSEGQQRISAANTTTNAIAIPIANRRSQRASPTRSVVLCARSSCSRHEATIAPTSPAASITIKIVSVTDRGAAPRSGRRRRG
jgi:uncharacterized protein (DUF2126 family)